MTKVRSPWLDRDMRSLVRRGAALEAAPAAAKARIRARVEAVVGSATGDAAGSGDTPHPSGEPLLRGGTRALAIVAAFALGGGVGALVMHRLGHAPPTEETIAPSAERVAPTAIAAPLGNALSAEPPPNATAPRVPPAAPVFESTMPVAREAPLPAAAAPSPKAPASGARDPVADERTLLDAARVAVEREDGAAALASTDEHARKYPGGVLVQEREAIAVRALVLLGRTNEARARVERFRERFPDSLLLPALESTTGAGSMP